MATFAVDAIVLNRRDIGEADRLITIFSRTMGKQRVVAKGVRRTTSRMAAHLEPGRESHLFLVERRSLPLVTQAQTQHLFISPNADLAELKDLFNILEITASLLDDNQRDSRFYELIIATLTRFKLITSQPEPLRSANRQLLSAAFMLKALHMLGFSIELTQCVACSKPLLAEPNNAAEPAGSTANDPSHSSAQPAEFYLSAARGGVAHKDCGMPGPGVFVITAEALRTMRKLLGAKLDTLETLTKGSSGSELTRPIVAFVEWTSERTLKSSQL
jgi:DNA repair protein RecO (recombination protein O)